MRLKTIQICNVYNTVAETLICITKNSSVQKVSFAPPLNELNIGNMINLINLNFHKLLEISSELCINWVVLVLLNIHEKDYWIPTQCVWYFRSTLSEKVLNNYYVALSYLQIIYIFWCFFQTIAARLFIQHFYDLSTK